MARKKKSSKDAEAEVEQVAVNDTDDTSPEEAIDAAAENPAQDVEQPEETAETEDTKVEETETAEVSDDAEASDEAAEPLVLSEQAEPEDGAPGGGEDAPLEEDAPEEPIISQPPPAPAPEIVRKGGFFPMVLGGLAAAAIGFGLARFVLPETGADTAMLTDIQRTLETQSGAVSKLTARVETLESGGGLSTLEAAQADNQAAISGLSDRLADLESRLTGIENMPVGEGASTAALATYQQELSDLRSQVDAMTQHAALLEENAQSAAQATLRRAALTRIQTALDAGVGFADAVADLEGLGVSIPAALQDTASSGAPSLTDLQDSFPEVARLALSAARDASGGADEGGGVTSFLRSQLGVRSLQPREGNDSDAILSRAEAAARDGRLTDALAEIDALPEEARAELSDWTSQATLRLNAVGAAQELGESLN